MRRRPHRPGAGLLLLTVAALTGALAGVVVDAFLWSLSAPGGSLGDAYAHARRGLATPDSPAWWVAGFGAATLVVLTGAVRGTFRNLGSTLGSASALAFGGATGALVGGASFLGVWAVRRAGLPPWRLLAAAPDAVAEAPLALAGFLVLGATIGIAVMAFLLDDRAVQALSAALIGLTLGALTGTVLYALATVTLEDPAAWTAPDVVLRVGEAASAFDLVEAAYAGFGAAVGVVVGRNRWRFFGLVTFVSLLSVVGGFLVYSLFVTLPRVEPQFRAFAWTLFAVETGSLAMVLLYSFYSIDVSARKAWRRGPEGRPHSRYFAPKVAFQVPCFNEPPELVLDTLRAVLAVDYPRDRLVVMVLDDSTDPAASAPLARFCGEHDLVYIHRDDRTGYKAGALNHSLPSVPDDVDLLAIIDADYQVRPDYLRETVGYFVDLDLGWIQTPQDYRNPRQSFLTEQYYLADAYFYRTVMPSRNEENTIIFAGTMGILRKEALVDVGGWGEAYITEDAELSLRLALAGYSSLYVNKTYGRGLIPATFDGYKKQHYRWAFGGGKILRGHFHHLLFGRLTRRQAFDYFVGTVHWFEGLFIFLVTLFLLSLAGAQFLGLELATHHSEEILLIGLIPFFVLLDGLTRLHTVMRGAMRLSMARTSLVLGMWFAVKFSNARAAMKGFLGFHVPFVRTPKAPTARVGRGEAWRRALRVTPFESLMATVTLAFAGATALRLRLDWALLGERQVPASFLLVWLLYYFLIYGSAPFYAYKSYVTFRPEEEHAGAARVPTALAGPSRA